MVKGRNVLMQKEEVEKLCETVHKFSQDIGVKFGLDKCAVLELKSCVRERRDSVIFPDGGMMQDVDENGYKYLGVLEAGGMMVKEMKEKGEQRVCETSPGGGRVWTDTWEFGWGCECVGC